MCDRSTPAGAASKAWCRPSCQRVPSRRDDRGRGYWRTWSAPSTRTTCRCIGWSRSSSATVRKSPWIQCDDTTLDVQDPSRALEIRTGHLWVYRGELGEVVYDFTWSRNRDGPLKMLTNYRGYL